MLARVIFSILSVASMTLAVPAALDPTTLAANAKEAQRLNTFYDSLTIGQSCKDGLKACVNGSPALCVNKTWTLSNTGCPDQQSCFALPSVRSNGTVLACASQDSANAIFVACGALDGTNAVTSSPSKSISATSSSTASSTFTTTTATDYDVVVTTTLTINPTDTLTLTSVTATMAPNSAREAVSSMVADGGKVYHVCHTRAQTPFEL